MTKPARIKIHRPRGKTVGIRITPDHHTDGIHLKAGPLTGTITRENAYQLANHIADTLEGNTND